MEGALLRQMPYSLEAEMSVLGGVLIFLTSIMVSVANVDGARILANLSGWVCMIIEIILITGAFRLMKHPEKYNYVEYGRPDDAGDPPKKNKINWKALLIPGYTK